MTKRKIYDQITEKEAKELERMVKQIKAERNRLIEMDANWITNEWPDNVKTKVRNYSVLQLFKELDLTVNDYSRYMNIKGRRSLWMQRNEDYFRILEALKNEINGTGNK